MGVVTTVSRLLSTRVSKHGARFGEWRAVRPFLGGVLLVLGGTFIASTAIFLAPGSLVLAHANPAPVGLLAATAVFLCGIFSLAEPSFAGPLGVVGVVSAIVSLVGTPLAAFVGVALSLVGGNLCYAWRPDGADEG